MARFRLTRVLRLREQQRRQAEAALQQTVAAQQAAEATVAAVRDTQRQEWTATQTALGAGMTARELHGRVDRMAGLAIDEAAGLAHVAALATEREQRRAGLTVARREERKLERLFERWTEREAVVTARATERGIDETALRGHGRRK